MNWAVRERWEAIRGECVYACVCRRRLMDCRYRPHFGAMSRLRHTVDPSGGEQVSSPLRDGHATARSAKPHITSRNSGYGWHRPYPCPLAAIAQAALFLRAREEG
jgi:hypothetical protein